MQKVLFNYTAKLLQVLWLPFLHFNRCARNIEMVYAKEIIHESVTLLSMITFANMCS